MMKMVGVGLSGDYRLETGSLQLLLRLEGPFRSWEYRKGSPAGSSEDLTKESRSPSAMPRVL